MIFLDTAFTDKDIERILRLIRVKFYKLDKKLLIKKTIALKDEKVIILI